MFLPHEFIYVIFTSVGTVSITLDLFATIETSTLQLTTVIKDRTYPVNREQFSIVAPVGWEAQLRVIEPKSLRTWSDGSFLCIQNKYGKIKLPIHQYIKLWVDKVEAIDQVLRKELEQFLLIEDDYCIVDGNGVHTSKGIVSIPAFKVEGKVNVSNIQKLLTTMTHPYVIVWRGENRIMFAGMADGEIKGQCGISVQL